MILIALLLLFAQAPEGPPENPASSTVVRSSPTGTEFRQSVTRTSSGNTEVVTEITETPGPDNRLRPSTQTVTETTKLSETTSQTREATYSVDAQGQRRLVESRQIDSEKLPGGGTRDVESTFVPDANGRLSLTSRQVRESQPSGPNMTQTGTTLFTPDINTGGLRESERVQEVERKVGDALTHTESTRSLRDVNNRWQVTESRTQEVRTSPGERVEEELRKRAEPNGTMSVVERKVTRTTSSPAQEQQITEIYSPNVVGLLRRTDNKLDLERRERVTTTKGPSGSRETIREVEERNPVAPNEPLRVVARTVETVSRVGDQWRTERRTYALDGNGRLTLVSTETQTTSAK